jgi:hypothetical protein
MFQYDCSQLDNGTRFRRYRSAAIGSSEFSSLQGETSTSYTATFEDIGRRIKCECSVTDYMDRRSRPVAAITPPVEAGTAFTSVPLPSEAGTGYIIGPFQFEAGTAFLVVPVQIEAGMVVHLCEPYRGDPTTACRF